MRVALVAPPEYHRRLHFARGVIPPLGVAYLASTLLERGHDVLSVDALGEAPHRFSGRGHDTRRGLPPDEVVQRLPHHVDVIGVSCRYTCMVPLDRQLIAALRRAHPEATLVVGGAHASACAAEMLADGAVDFVVIGEGEQTLGDLVDALAAGRDPRRLPGLAF